MIIPPMTNMKTIMSSFRGVQDSLKVLTLNYEKWVHAISKDIYSLVSNDNPKELSKEFEEKAPGLCNALEGLQWRIDKSMEPLKMPDDVSEEEEGYLWLSNFNYAFEKPDCTDAFTSTDPIEEELPPRIADPDYSEDEESPDNERMIGNNYVEANALQANPGESPLVSLENFEDSGKFWLKTQSDVSSILDDELLRYNIDDIKKIPLKKIIVGNYCMAPCPKDESEFARAKILGVNENLVDIFFIDEGLRTSLVATSLYRMPSGFKDLPGEIILCRFKDAPASDVPPISENTMEFLRGCSGLCLYAKFGPPGKDDVYPVELTSDPIYDSGKSLTLNYNETKTVEQSTLPNLQDESFLKAIQKVPLIDKDDFTKRFGAWRKKSGNRKKIISLIQRNDSSEDDGAADVRPIFLTLNPGRLHVMKMSSFISPQEIYLQKWDQLNYYVNRQEQLNDFYTSAVMVEMDKMPIEGSFWAAQVGCVWYRVQITRINVITKSATTATTLLIDMGVYKTYDLYSLQPLGSQFMNYPAMSYQVELCGLTPLNGVHWSEEDCATLKGSIPHQLKVLVKVMPVECVKSLQSVLMRPYNFPESITINHEIAIHKLGHFDKDTYPDICMTSNEIPVNPALKKKEGDGNEKDQRKSCFSESKIV